ncbi:MAG: phosphoglucosamine mutase [Saprospiraceae bacterium]|nr:phosphoglucosamine mutase [Saprospiraceae bacterium]MBP7680056.1 phosphoglucosamine mutase [Saprospiraceae bacterium]
MYLIKSISGIRGVIGGMYNNNFTPQDIVECTAAFGTWVLQKQPKNATIVIGRDARISGELVSGLVANTLRMLGIHVVDLGLSTTPTVEMAVPMLQAVAGIILTASHNPKQWNALKFLNDKGEFISPEDGQKVLDILSKNEMRYAEVDTLGAYKQDDTMIAKHIEAILKLPLVAVSAIREKQYKVVVDCINSTGAISVVPLLEQLGCSVVAIHANMHGNFAHNPEPLPEHLTDLATAVKEQQAGLGIVVDPDVDRLAFMCEDGSFFGEEYTLVAVADYVLSKQSGAAVSNLSSSQALRDVAQRHGCAYHSAAVGEVNVVNKMKATEAVIGGEGNGGVILPALHYGRDSLVGVALFLSLLAEKNMTVSALRKTYPEYVIVKDKIQLTPTVNVDHVLEQMKYKYKAENINTIDGLKIDFGKCWVHLRKSNTEPIIRVYAESANADEAKALADTIKKEALLLAGL